MNLKVALYKTLLQQISRGNYRGTKINAKPLYMICLIDAISKGILLSNKIEFITDEIMSLYISICKEYEPEKKPTPIEMPYFHLNKEPFYSIKFKAGIKPPKQANSPSSKFLRENVEYAYLDSELWDLLLDPVYKEELRNALIKHYFSSK